MKKLLLIVLIALLASSVHAAGDKLNGWQLHKFLCSMGLVQYCKGKPTDHCQWKPCNKKP
jgi:hypothetical protein